MVGNFHLQSGKVQFGTMIDDNEPISGEVKQNGIDCERNGTVNRCEVIHSTLIISKTWQ